MSDWPGEMTAQQMIDSGILQEVNRRFFHPLGLAMYVSEEGMGVFIDDDPEGCQFGGELLKNAYAKARSVQDEIDRRRPVREAALGYWVQPVEKS